jgi:hypothetical protein
MINLKVTDGKVIIKFSWFKHAEQKIIHIERHQPVELERHVEQDTSLPKHRVTNWLTV